MAIIRQFCFSILVEMAEKWDFGDICFIEITLRLKKTNGKLCLHVEFTGDN
jgi:hypothetical protein